MKSNRLLVLAIAIGWTGCQPLPPPAPPAKGPATMWVTESYVSELSPPASFTADGRSVLEITKALEQVGTSNHGSFITTIQGQPENPLSSEEGNWFYTVNGIPGHMGSGAYVPRAGDVLWWDLHPWSEKHMPRALIGAFPRPFVGGYDGNCPPVLLLHSSQFAPEAEHLSHTLTEAGVNEVRKQILSPSLPVNTRENQVLAVGTWADLQKHPLLADLHANANRTGLYFQFEGAFLNGLDWQGNPALQTNEGAVIAAAYLGTGQDFPVWLVAGTDQESIHRACALLRSIEPVRGQAALLVLPDETVSLPYVPPIVDMSIRPL